MLDTKHSNMRKSVKLKNSYFTSGLWFSWPRYAEKFWYVVWPPQSNLPFYHFCWEKLSLDALMEIKVAKVSPCDFTSFPVEIKRSCITQRRSRLRRSASNQVWLFNEIWRWSPVSWTRIGIVYVCVLIRWLVLGCVCDWCYEWSIQVSK